MLKFCDWHGKVRAFRKAFNHSPKSFRSRHLVEMDGDAVRLDDWWLIFQRIAGGDFSTVRPLAELVGRGDEFARYCKTITVSVIADWNREHPKRPRSFTVRTFLQRILGDRIGPGGPILGWAATIGIPANDGSPYISRPGWERRLPNPLTLIAHQPFSDIRIESVLVGQAHGDLSGRNILVPTQPKVRAADYLLIDFDRYETDAPLARDPMHLLVALAVDTLSEYDPASSLRRELIKVIVDPYATDVSIHTNSFRQISKAIHVGSAEWATKQGFGNCWRTQALLSLVAVALMHVGRDLPTKHSAADREWCFELAAAATDAYLAAIARQDPYAPQRQAKGNDRTSAPPSWSQQVSATAHQERTADGDQSPEHSSVESGVPRVSWGQTTPQSSAWRKHPRRSDALPTTSVLEPKPSNGSRVVKTIITLLAVVLVATLAIIVLVVTSMAPSPPERDPTGSAARQANPAYSTTAVSTTTTISTTPRRLLAIWAVDINGVCRDHLSTVGIALQDMQKMADELTSMLGSTNILDQAQAEKYVDQMTKSISDAMPAMVNLSTAFTVIVQSSQSIEPPTAVQDANAAREWWQQYRKRAQEWEETVSDFRNFLRDTDRTVRAVDLFQAYLNSRAFVKISPTVAELSTQVGVVSCP